MGYQPAASRWRSILSYSIGQLAARSSSSEAELSLFELTGSAAVPAKASITAAHPKTADPALPKFMQVLINLFRVSWSSAVLLSQGG